MRRNQRAARGAVAVGEAVAQRVVLVLACEGRAHGFGEAQPRREVEAKVREQCVDARQHQAPAEIGTRVAAAFIE